MKYAFKKIIFMMSALVFCMVLNINAIFSNEIKEDNLSGLNDEYFNIYNPMNGSRSIVDKNGKVIISTIGLDNYSFNDFRQEDIGITLDEETKEKYFYRIYNNRFVTLYDKDMNLLLEKVIDITIKNGIIEYYDEGSSYIYKWEYDIKTNEKRKIDLAELRAKMIEDAINIKSSNDVKKEPIKYPISIHDDEYFSVIQNKDKKYEFESKKYGFKIENINKFAEVTGKEIFNSKVYKLETELSTDYISNDGKLILRDFMSKNKLYFVNDKYIVTYNSYDLKENEIHIYTYGDEPKAFYKKGNVKLIVYQNNDYHVIKKHDFRYFNLDFISLENKLYVKIIEEYAKGKSKIYDLEGNNADIECNNTTYTIKNNKDKYNLYDINGKLLRKDLTSSKVYDLNDIESLYDNFKDCHVIKVNNKFELIDKQGKTILKNLDYTNVNDTKADESQYESKHYYYKRFYPDKAKYLMVVQNNKYQVYNDKGKLLFKDLFGSKVYRQGDYYLLEVLNEKGFSRERIYNYKNKLIHINDEPMQYPFDIYVNIRYNSNFYGSDNDSSIYHTYMTMDLIKENWHNGFVEINGDLCIYDYKKNKYELYDIDGNVLLNDYRYLSRYDDKYLLYVKGFKYGLIDRDGNILFSFSIFDNYDDE